MTDDDAWEARMDSYIEEAEKQITALRAEVEEWRRLYERAEASIQYGYAPEADQLRSQLSARDAEVRALQFDQRDLVALVGRLCRALPQDDDRRIQAMGYLTRKNLLGSVLRALTCEPGPGGEG
jgi:chromosome segregation ATPase